MTSFWQRFPPPLRISIPLLMLVFSLGFVTLNTWLLLRSDLRLAEDRVIDQAERTAARLAEMVSSRQGTSEADLKRELAFLGRDPRVHWAVICNQDQTIVFTTQTQEAGWVNPPPLACLHRRWRWPPRGPGPRPRLQHRSQTGRLRRAPAAQ
ncbi:hypothetical protein [Verrucomicrobium spinosum]|uniref:hypothetical protein n=1 Tax=Verrucomicrobium spinosum TaxID=2736 RepID=UPI0009462ACB|nr:hypothetical protein [Verrucomicrobium spinosum]